MRAARQIGCAPSNKEVTMLNPTVSLEAGPAS